MLVLTCHKFLILLPVQAAVQLQRLEDQAEGTFGEEENIFHINQEEQASLTLLHLPEEETNQS